jgi:hypothetical protein
MDKMIKKAGLPLMILLAASLACNLQATGVGHPLNATESLAAPTQTLPSNPDVSLEETKEAFATQAMETPGQAPAATSTSSTKFPQIVRVKTRYEGMKEYICDTSGCWRVDGELVKTPEYFFPDINLLNPEVQTLIADIGLPTTSMTGDKEKWERAMRLWSWWTHHAGYFEDASGKDAYNYLLEITKKPKPHLPSIGDWANVYARYHIIPVSSCSDNALFFALMLYRFGADPDEVTIAEAQWKIQRNPTHLFVVMRLEGRWHYVDPSCVQVDPDLPTEPQNVGCIAEADYQHPFALWLLPGSTLKQPMLLTDTGYPNT